MKRVTKVLAAAVTLFLTSLMFPKGPEKKDVSEQVRLVGPLDMGGNPTRAGDFENYDDPNASLDISVGLRYRSGKLRLHESLLRASLVSDQNTCEHLTDGFTSHSASTDPQPDWDEASGCYYSCDPDPSGWCNTPFYGQVRFRKDLGLFEFYFDTQLRPTLGEPDGVCRWAGTEDLEYRDQTGSLPDDVCRYALETKWGHGISDGEDVAFEPPASTVLYDMLAAPPLVTKVGVNSMRGTVFDLGTFQDDATNPPSAVTAQYTITGDVNSTEPVDIGTDVWTFGTITLSLSDVLMAPLELPSGTCHGKARLSVLTDDLLSSVLLRRFDFHFGAEGCHVPTPEPQPVGDVCRYSLTVLYGIADSTGVEFSATNPRVSRALLFDQEQELSDPELQSNGCNDPTVEDWIYAPLVLRGGSHCVASISGVNISLASGGIPEPPAVESSCKNGKDDDGDGLVDCADSDCYTSKFCK